MEVIKYRSSVVAFIDVLGFSDLVNTTRKSRVSTSDLINRVKDLDKVISPEPYVDTLELDERVKFFSDSISYSIRYRPWALLHALGFLMHLQIEFFLKGFFVRGGVSTGYHYEDDTVLIGPAFIRAYRIADELAIYPRIVIKPSTVNSYSRKSWSSECNEFFADDETLRIRRDRDGLFYVDYLKEGVLWLYGTDFWDIIKGHKDAIYAQVRKTRDTKVLSKYFWLVNYHNTVVRELKHRKGYDPKYRINRKDLFGKSYPTLR